MSRDLKRKLAALDRQNIIPEKSLTESYAPTMAMIQKAIQQKRQDPNKVYSFYKPHTVCIAKGKAHKKFEFGNKVGFLMEGRQQVITVAAIFEKNIHDSKTIDPLLKQCEQRHSRPDEVVCNRGGVPRSARPSSPHQANRSRTPRPMTNRRCRRNSECGRPSSRSLVI